MNPAEFHRIDLATWPRREHFLYYQKLVRTNYNLTVNVDISALKHGCESRSLRFYPVFIYAVTKAVNRIREFRMALDPDGTPGWYDYLNPSYTVFHRDDETFSDVWSPWDEDFSRFYDGMIRDMERYGQIKGIKSKPDKPDAFLPVSGVPWTTFTGYGSDTFTPPHMLFPVVTFGRFFPSEVLPDCLGRIEQPRREGADDPVPRLLIPVNVFVPHMVADGYHTCKFFSQLQQICDDADAWLKGNKRKGAFL